MPTAYITLKVVTKQVVFVITRVLTICIKPRLPCKQPLPGRSCMESSGHYVLSCYQKILSGFPFYNRLIFSFCLHFFASN